MSTIKSSTEHLTLNADGSGKEIKLQANGVEKAKVTSTGIDVTGNISTSAVTGAEIEIRSTDTSITAGEVFGGLKFRSDDTNGTQPHYSGIKAKAADTYGGASLELYVGRDRYESDDPRVVIEGPQSVSGEAMRIDSSGNVGIGVTPETSNKTGDLHGVWGSIGGWSNTMFFNNNAYYNSGWKYKNTALASSYESKDGKHYFYVAPSGTADSAISWTNAMTIDNSGNVNIGAGATSSLAGMKLYGQGANAGTGVLSHGSATNTHNMLIFRNGNGDVGTIQTVGSSTSYNTSSDYRLKENVVPMTGSIDRLKALKPSKFNFIADADKTVDGFLAHEAGEVVPECATGEKDAMRTEEYEVTPAEMNSDGDVINEAVMGEREVPDYQGIDQSKLVPLLVASLQEAVAKIETLESKVEALEA